MAMTVQNVGRLVEKHSTLATVVLGLVLAVDVLSARLDAAAATGEVLADSLEQVVDRLDRADMKAQTQFKLMRELRNDVTSNDKQIMILQVNDQQMWQTINGIREYVPSSINKLETTVAVMAKDIDQLRELHETK